MILNVNSPKEFNDACKEYFKYHLSRYTISENEQGNDFIIEGISFMITTPEQFNNPEVRELFGSNVCILDEGLPLLGKICCPKNTTHPNLDTGTFIGIEATEEDFYYVLERENGSKCYESCVGSIVEVKED